MKNQPWYATPYADMPENWTWLIGNAGWEDYGASWYKFLPDGSALLIRFENMIEAMGERDCARDNVPEFLAELLWVDLPNIPKSELDSVLSGCGWRFSHYQGEGANRRFVVENSCDHELIVPDPIPGGDICDRRHLVDNDEYQRGQRRVLLDTCENHGTYAVLDSWDTPNRPLVLLKQAREAAKEFMADRRPYMNKSVNRIGTTVAQAASGNLLGGLQDYAKTVLETGEAPDQAQNLTLKLYGVDVVEIQEQSKRGYGCTMRKSDIQKCPFMIFLPEHYRSDGSCKCDDPEHREKMIQEWEYTAEHFKDIPVRKE